MAAWGPRPLPGYYSSKFPNTHVQGVEEVMANLNVQIKLIKGASVEGLVEAAKTIRRDTEATAPITPLDLGNLRASWFVTTAKKSEGNDKWNKGFVAQSKNSSSTADVARLTSDHANAIAESQAKLSSLSGQGIEGVTMGYSANYAVYVHENLKAKFKRSQSGAKWFQAAVARNSSKILGIVAQKAKIKP